MPEGRTEPTRQGHKVPESRRTSSLFIFSLATLRDGEMGKGFSHRMSAMLQDVLWSFCLNLNDRSSVRGSSESTLRRVP